jgi:hypothetical protein
VKFRPKFAGAACFYQPRARHSARCGRSTPNVVSAPQGASAPARARGMTPLSFGSFVTHRRDRTSGGRLQVLDMGVARHRGAARGSWSTVHDNAGYRFPGRTPTMIVDEVG